MRVDGSPLPMSTHAPADAIGTEIDAWSASQCVHMWLPENAELHDAFAPLRPPRFAAFGVVKPRNRTLVPPMQHASERATSQPPSPDATKLVASPPSDVRTSPVWMLMPSGLPPAADDVQPAHESMSVVE